MIARVETSTNAQSPQAEKSGSKGMSVALIGPNDAHRQIVARALATTQGRKVHEFIDYPDALNDLPRMVEQSFDVVLVDVDTDESYALQIIEKLAEIGQSVMAYSARTDQELLMSCMRAGARDFLPLPTEGGQEPSRPAEPAVQPAAPPVAKPVAAAAPPVVSKPVEPKAAPLPPVPTVRTNVTPIVPEKRIEPTSEPWPTRIREEQQRDAEIAQVIEEITIPAAQDGFAQGTAPSEFAEWDAANLRRAQTPPLPSGKRPEARPRPALVPERRKTETSTRTFPGLESTPAPAIERPPVAVDLFRSSQTQTQTESEPDEAAEKQGANWVKWILIAAGPLVLALVLLVVFTRSSTPNPAATQVKAGAGTVTQPSEAEPAVTPGAKTSVKPVAGSAVVKPTAEPGASDETTSTERRSPSSDAMAAQLVAPTRIAGQIKKTAADEPPPTAPAPVSMDDNSGVPGTVFGSANRAKVAPRAMAISAGVADGMLVHKTPPVYPKFAQEAHISGKVVLKATITKQGTIEGVQVLSGPKILAPSAVDAVKTWKYKPYTLDGQPVSVETNITVVFGDAGK